MTDRELLELAARAAGIEVACVDELGVVPSGTREDGPRRGTWNPLTDDGDALRLAVKLRIELRMTDPLAVSAIGCGYDRMKEWITPHNGGDPYAATRRAIVRAAAMTVQPEGEQAKENSNG